jgi:carbon monoxide dehydrogenase subunit G
VRIDVSAEVRVARPPAEVAAYMTDPGNDPEWIGGLREARLQGDPPVRAGSRVARIASFLGKRVEYVNEVVAVDDRHLEMRSVVAPFPMHITYSFDPDGAGTVVRNRVRGEPGGFFAVFGPLLGPMVRRSVQRDLERLREVLEERGGGGATRPRS